MHISLLTRNRKRAMPEYDLNQLADGVVVANATGQADLFQKAVAALIAGVRETKPRALKEWSEDHGNALWWHFPVDEPPYVGTPLDTDWPGYHTHWTPISVPTQ